MMKRVVQEVLEIKNMSDRNSKTQASVKKEEKRSSEKSEKKKARTLRK